MLQLVPSHESTMVAVVVDVETLPTPWHALAAVQNTPDSRSEVAPDGNGVDSKVQLVPSHLSDTATWPLRIAW
jgi:hypothetical protein